MGVGWCWLLACPVLFAGFQVSPKGPKVRRTPLETHLDGPSDLVIDFFLVVDYKSSMSRKIWRNVGTKDGTTIWVT